MIVLYIILGLIVVFLWMSIAFKWDIKYAKHRQMKVNKKEERE